MSIYIINDNFTKHLLNFFYKYDIFNRPNQSEKDTSVSIRIIASFLIIFSGVMLFIDKISTFGITATFGYSDVQTMIWVLMQTLSPMILCFASLFKPYKIVYFGTIYFYFIQLYWVVYPDSLHLDDSLLNVYALGFCVLSFVTFIFTMIILKIVVDENKILLQNIKKLTSHIVLSIKGGYIKEEKKEEYMKETIEIFDSLD